MKKNAVKTLNIGRIFIQLRPSYKPTVREPRMAPRPYITRVEPESNKVLDISKFLDDILMH